MALSIHQNAQRETIEKSRMADTQDTPSLFESGEPKDWTWREWSIIAGGIVLLIVIVILIAVFATKSQPQPMEMSPLMSPSPATSFQMSPEFEAKYRGYVGPQPPVMAAPMQPLVRTSSPYQPLPDSTFRQ